MTVASTLNFSPTTPAAQDGYINVTPQNDGGAPTCNQSFEVPIATGSQLGVVQPDGTTITIDAGVISAASSGGTFTQETVTFSGTSGTLAHTPLSGAFFALFRNCLIMATSGAPTIQTYSISGSDITLSTAEGSGDWFYALYYH